MDADPHGLDILSIYKYGSRLLKHEGESLESPKLKWIGLSFKETMTYDCIHLIVTHISVLLDLDWKSMLFCRLASMTIGR